MKILLLLFFLCMAYLTNGQCTTYGSNAPVNFSGTCNETANRNHNGNGVLTISGDLSWSSGTFNIRGPVVVTGSLTFTGTSTLRILVNGSLEVRSGATVTGRDVEVGADGSLTIDAGGVMSATSLTNDAFGPLNNTVTVNGVLTVSPGNFLNNSDGIIAGNGTINADIVDNGTSVFTGIHNGSCTGNCSGVLPVELISFSAIQKGNNCELAWETASEINNEGFYVERSINPDQGFMDVGFVSGNGDSEEIIRYRYVDTSASGGRYYYRLKQVDYDGKFEYSPIIYHQQDKLEDPSIFIYQNQVTQQIVFSYWPDGIDKVELMTLDGRRMLEEVTTSKSNAEELISSFLSRSPKGAYLLNIYSFHKTYTLRVINSVN
ncbi:MAG: T9SS type A sorting domain-containing protein [Bacteroidota bacterium]